MLFLLVWLVFGYVGVIGIPMTWLIRNTVERVEIDNSYYRHLYANLPWWFPKEWKTKDVTRIDYGSYDEESITTLNVRCGWKRDMIAYRAKDDFRRLLFEALRTHLGEIHSSIEVVDLSTRRK